MMILIKQCAHIESNQGFIETFFFITSFKNSHDSTKSQDELYKIRGLKIIVFAQLN